MKKTLIAALSDNHVIGKANDLPWRIPADLKHFKATTLDHVVVMGVNTWKSFGSQPLPRRRHIVITNRVHSVPVLDEYVGVLSVATSLDLALKSAAVIAAERGQDEFFVIGGASIYEQAIGLCDRMILTRVEGVFDGDKHFPPIGPEWHGVPREIDGSTIQESGGHRFSIWDYEKA